jgi:hypothetical protein
MSRERRTERVNAPGAFGMGLAFMQGRKEKQKWHSTRS